MRILIVDTYYPQFLRAFWTSRRDLHHGSYRERHAALMACHFAEADSYSFYLRRLGHEAEEIIANAEFLQLQWAGEHGVRSASAVAILAEQVKRYRPDVLYLQNMSWLDDAQLAALRPHVKLIVGQIASPLPAGRDFSAFDLILSSFPHFVRFFRNIGVPSECLRLGFDPRVLASIGQPGDSVEIPVAFVGGLSAAHSSGTLLLETVARELPLALWGYGLESLPAQSPLRRVHRGQVWGLDMYRVLAAARISLNRHIDVAGRFANNLRLYEATGVGSCLVTDARDNLPELFEPDREIVTYGSAEECVEKCRYLLDHEEERAAIARAGQRRTLSEHTWAHRMEELDRILARYLAAQPLPRRAEAAPPRHTRALGSNVRLRHLAKRLPGQRFVQAVYHRLAKPTAPRREVSTGHRLIAPTQVGASLTRGWQAPEIAARQRELVDAQLQQMYQGDVPAVFRAAAEAVQATGVRGGMIVEVGCASGYYWEVLEHLLRSQVRYLGVDYSTALVDLARQRYPNVPFVVGDAANLPLPDGCCDILLSGCVLLHVADYAAAIRESSRVSRRWCIFHRTPVLRTGNTVFLSKLAYGVEVVELLFGKQEIYRLFAESNLAVERAIHIDSCSIGGVGGKVDIITYVCRKGGSDG